MLDTAAEAPQNRRHFSIPHQRALRTRRCYSRVLPQLKVGSLGGVQEASGWRREIGRALQPTEINKRRVARLGKRPVCLRSSRRQLQDSARLGSTDIAIRQARPRPFSVQPLETPLHREGSWSRSILCLHGHPTGVPDRQLIRPSPNTPLWRKKNVPFAHH